MQPDFISISEAAARTGKSQDSIRRLIKTILQDDSNASHVKQERLTNGSSKYYIDSVWLTSHLANAGSTPPSANLAQGSHTKFAQGASRSVNDDHSDQLAAEVIQILRQQLDEKDRQISNFQERDREHNVIIKNLQDRMLLIEAPRAPEQDGLTIESQPAPEQTQEPQRPPRGFFWQRRRRKY